MKVPIPDLPADTDYAALIQLAKEILPGWSLTIQLQPDAPATCKIKLNTESRLPDRKELGALITQVRNQLYAILSGFAAITPGGIPGQVTRGCLLIQLLAILTHQSLPTE